MRARNTPDAARPRKAPSGNSSPGTPHLASAKETESRREQLGFRDFLSIRRQPDRKPSGPMPSPKPPRQGNPPPEPACPPGKATPHPKTSPVRSSPANTPRPHPYAPATRERPGLTRTPRPQPPSSTAPLQPARVPPFDPHGRGFGPQGPAEPYRPHGGSPSLPPTRPTPYLHGKRPSPHPTPPGALPQKSRRKARESPRAHAQTGTDRHTENSPPNAQGSGATTPRKAPSGNRSRGREKLASAKGTGSRRDSLGFRDSLKLPAPAGQETIRPSAPR